ncbi:hypothetical protein WDW37_06620 [Bdellovibrionota bacterium FG-1]
MESFSSKTLKHLLKQRQIATLEDLKTELGTSVDVTIFRKLKELSYLTSYSHRGMYYTIPEIAEFDRDGLWCCQSTWFSKYGNLLKTIAAFVNRAPNGYHADELENALHVEVKQALLTLIGRHTIQREKISGLYVYCSNDVELRRKQLTIRREQEAEPGFRMLGHEVIPDELKAAIILFFCLLDEQQQRLYAGLESLKLGHGGDRKIGELLGLDAHTVAAGRRQLLAQDVEIDRTRREGGGRVALEKKHRRS